MKPIIILMTVLSFFMISCSQKHFNYYKDVETDGKDQIIGLVPLSDKDGSVSTCYHFIYEKGKPVSIEYLKNGKLANGSYWGDKVARVIIQNDKGFIRHIYKDIYGNPTASNENIFGTRLKLDDKGYPVSRFNYDKNDKLTLDDTGVAQYLWTIDSKGNRISSMRMSIKGERIYDNNGVYCRKWKYDKQAKMIESSFHGKDGQLAVDSSGVALIKYAYNKQGLTTEISLYGPDEQRVEDITSNVSTKKTAYNDKGNLIELSHYGVDGQLKETNDGYAIQRYKYDDKGNVTETRYYGIDNQLKLTSGGCAVIKTQVDSNGNNVSVSGFGIDEKPIKNILDDYHTEVYKYDEYRNIIERSFKDDKGMYVALKSGAAFIRFKHDKYGNPIEKSFYDVKNNPIEIDDGSFNYFMKKGVFDNNQNLIEYSFWDKEGNPKSQYLGVQKVRYTYENNEHVKTSVYDIYGNLIFEN